MGTTLDGIRLRQYREEDRREVRRICCETGFLGYPIDPIYQDRELFADLLMPPPVHHLPLESYHCTN